MRTLTQRVKSKSHVRQIRETIKSFETEGQSFGEEFRRYKSAFPEPVVKSSRAEVSAMRQALSDKNQFIKEKQNHIRDLLAKSAALENQLQEKRDDINNRKDRVRLVELSIESEFEKTRIVQKFEDFLGGVVSLRDAMDPDALLVDKTGYYEVETRDIIENICAKLASGPKAVPKLRTEIQVRPRRNIPCSHCRNWPVFMVHTLSFVR